MARHTWPTTLSQSDVTPLFEKAQEAVNKLIIKQINKYGFCHYHNYRIIHNGVEYEAIGHGKKEGQVGFGRTPLKAMQDAISVG